MSADPKMTSRIRWDEEGACVKFVDLPYESSEEIASGFIVDRSPDHKVAGLEILWPESQRAGSAREPVLAFGLFCAALAGLSWQYGEYLRNPAARRHPADGIYRRLQWMVSASGLNLGLSRDTSSVAYGAGHPLDLAILDDAGNPLICAEIKRGRFEREVVQRYTHLLRSSTIPAYSGAIGVGIFIDDTGQGDHNDPVEPGVWTCWHNTRVHGSKVWAHNTIIPPSGCDYQWLPRELRDPVVKGQG